MTEWHGGKGDKRRKLQVSDETFSDNWSKIFSKNKETKTMKIVTISDTHNKHRDIDMPEGDVLVVAGDFTGTGATHQVAEFNEWLGELDFEHIIVVAGNHELSFEDPRRAMHLTLTNAHYLKDRELILDGVKFYGAPWQPEFCDWAFNLSRGEELAEKWALIHDNTDVLITHGPPSGILDSNLALDDTRQGFGCVDLLHRVNAVKPKYHIFGHIHGGYGRHQGIYTEFVNTAICTEEYKPLNKPHVLEIEVKDGV